MKLDKQMYREISDALEPLDLVSPQLRHFNAFGIHVLLELHDLK